MSEHSNAARRNMKDMGLDPNAFDHLQLAGRTAASKPEAVLFTLSRGSRDHIFLAPIQARDWVETAKPGQRLIPDEVRQAMLPFLAPNCEIQGNLNEKVLVTRGNSDNDVAMMLAGVCRNFDTGRQAREYAKAQGWKMSQITYEGVIY